MSHHARLSANPAILAATLVALATAAGVAVLALAFPPVADERYYAAQVRLFVSGKMELEPGITMLPGYHALLAAVLAPFGEYSDVGARLANLLVGLAIFPLAWALARRDWPREAPLKAAQALLFPLLFPYLFLVYTESWTLVALFAMVVAALARRHALAALFGLAATVMRQDYIFWVAFTFVLAALEDVDLSKWRGQWRAIARGALTRALPYLPVMAAFAAFVAWNGSVAMGDRSVHMHPYNLANIWFFYLCAWIVFLPHCLAAWPRVLGLLKRPGIVAALAVGFAIYWTAWSNPHPYNQEHLRFWLHN
jgi:alpha-1,2-glucosyltransferase